VLLVNDDFVGMLRSINYQLNGVRTLVVLTDKPQPEKDSLEFAGEYEALLAAASPHYDFPDFDENAQATTFYTTGTTGLPKGVYFSHRQIVLHTLAELAALGMAPQQGRFHRSDVYMPITPMFHVHAWGFPWSVTTAGVKQVYPGRYTPDFLLRLIKTEGVTFTHGVPTILQMLLTAAESAGVDLSGLTMVVGGSALPKALALRAMDRGIDIYAGYGMSETGPVLTLAHLKSHHLTGKPDTEVEIRTRAGLAIPLVDLRIVDPEMAKLPHDGKATGEIVARAPWLTQGYFNSPEASEQLWAGGYLHTNDIANISPDGYVQITDRINDVIKTGGEWVSSLELEDIISQCEGVFEVAVIGIRDEKWGERPLALVVLERKPNLSVTEDDIKAHMQVFADKGMIPKYGIPQKIIFVEQLPKTSVGKIDKKTLRQTYDITT
jgi:fatty-acyl-CoA synthase